MAEYKIDLPKTNEYGFYEMRLESIGGLGANLSLHKINQSEE